MAKSKSFFGLRTGSTKTLTFQVMSGKQVTKDRVEIVKNPRTVAQMNQRCYMATASAAYAHMKQIVNHSFEGYSYGQQNMSKFIADNIALLKNAVMIGATDYGYNPYRDRKFYPGAYKISQGSLVPTVFLYDVSLGDNVAEIDLFSGSLAANFTANDVAAQLGLALGEMHTVCTIYQNNTQTGWLFGFTRIKFIKAGTTALTTANMSTYFELESSMGDAAWEVSGQTLTINLTNVNCGEGGSAYSGVIYSRKAANGWLRSTAYIYVQDGVEMTPIFEDAMATYPQGTAYVLNGGNF